AMPEFLLPIYVRFSLQELERKFLCLIDTGCRIPVVFRTGLCPVSLLSTAPRGINIVTADGSKMAGGQMGSKLILRIPTKVMAGACEFVTVDGQWGYEANITNDFIFGYPFLRQQLFAVDCVESCLRDVKQLSSPPLPLRLSLVDLDKSDGARKCAVSPGSTTLAYSLGESNRDRLGTDHSQGRPLPPILSDGNLQPQGFADNSLVRAVIDHQESILNLEGQCC
ncbi:hypothetical protein M569_10417, partial [Genlisea aurea]